MTVAENAVRNGVDTPTLFATLDAWKADAGRPVNQSELASVTPIKGSRLEWITR